MTQPTNGDLIAWLRAQLDDDERLAREAADLDSGRWFVGERWNVYRAEDEAPYDDAEANQLVVYGNVKPQSEHIARWDPARVLAEVDAKRRIIETLRSYEPNNEWHTQPDMGLRCNNAAGALRALALPYADRPSYREEWRPT